MSGKKTCVLGADAVKENDAAMEDWNREELYKDVWEQPLTKLMEKHGVSAVMLGKVCRKLKVPLPGRGYWAKLAFGKQGPRPLLPPAKDLPVITRVKPPESQPKQVEPPPPPAPEPTDQEYLRIKAVEGRPIVIKPGARRHPLIVSTAKAMKGARVDNKGFLMPDWEQVHVDLRVSRNTLHRALAILNAVILAIEAENFPVKVGHGRDGTTARIFGFDVPFSIVEKYRQKGMREVTEYSWTHRRMEYEPKGELEFRIGSGWNAWRYNDTKKRLLEESLPTLVGALMREGRARIIQAEQDRLAAIEQQKRNIARMELQAQIDAEEKKVAAFDGWVTAWTRAGHYRDFIAALEKSWAQQGADLSVESENGKQIIWMKQQADRLDPLVKSPPSILDRKQETRSWWS